MSIRRASPTLTATGIRDLPGITGRLSYLADLCVDAVWLSPRFASPMADFGYAVADHCSVDPVSARRRTSIHWSQRLLDGRLRVLIDFVGNESNEHELAALDGCPPRSDGTGVRLSAEEIAPTMPGTASARACSRRASAQSMRPPLAPSGSPGSRGRRNHSTSIVAAVTTGCRPDRRRICEKRPSAPTVSAAWSSCQ